MAAGYEWPGLSPILCRLTGPEQSKWTWRYTCDSTRKARNVVDHDIRTARAGLTQIIEPADSLGVQAVEAWGPSRVVEIIFGSTPTQQDWVTLSALDPGDGRFTTMLRDRLGEAIQRWRRRSEERRVGKECRCGGAVWVSENEAR